HRDLHAFPTRRSSDLAFLKPEDRVAFAVYEWSGQAHQDVIVDWTMVGTPADLERIRAAIAGHVREQDFLPTGLGAALAFGRDLIDRKSTRLNSSHVKI